MEERLERQARNESLTRTVNEQIAVLDARTGWAHHGERFVFHCECGVVEGCSATLQMTLAEYERVRTQQDRFAVIPGHETAALEVVVESDTRFLIVDKRDEFEQFVGGD